MRANNSFNLAKSTLALHDPRLPFGLSIWTAIDLYVKPFSRCLQTPRKSICQTTCGSSLMDTSSSWTSRKHWKKFVMLSLGLDNGSHAMRQSTASALLSSRFLLPSFNHQLNHLTRILRRFLTATTRFESFSAFAFVLSFQSVPSVICKSTVQHSPQSHYQASPHQRHHLQQHHGSKSKH